MGRKLLGDGIGNNNNKFDISCSKLCGWKESVFNVRKIVSSIIKCKCVH